MLEIETLNTFDTELSADSIEWCKTEGYQHFFSCGTYQLNADEQQAKTSRKGRVYLFSYDVETKELVKCQQIETDAILDQKWGECNQTPLLMTATSGGTVDTYSLNDTQLSNVRSVSLESDSLVLSIDNDTESSKIVASDSKGNITLMDIQASQPIIKQWNAHKFEAWTTAFDKSQKNVIYSGGDDSMCFAWDFRTEGEVMKLKSSTRDAGVTSFLSRENTLLIGSYDEKLCAHDLRNLKTPLHEICLNGGIWRIKPLNDNVLLVACMYHNFSVVEYTTDFRLMAEYFEHESICYGCDWSPVKNNNEAIFATCSFYDHKLAIAKLTL